MNDEIEEHLALQTEENLRTGLAPFEACRQALLKFGAVESIKEDYRDERRLPYLETLLREMRHAIRQVRKFPGFALTAIAVLGLGIGANIGVFSVANAVIFAPLPFTQPNRLVHIFESDLGERYRRGDKSNLITVRNGVFQNWRNQARCFESIAAAQYTQATLTDGDRASVADVNLVDEGFFRRLALQRDSGVFSWPATTPLAAHALSSPLTPPGATGTIPMIHHRPGNRVGWCWLSRHLRYAAGLSADRLPQWMAKHCRSSFGLWRNCPPRMHG